MKQRALRVGLTGGVASGKSAVAAMLHEFGAELVDADVVAREVVAPGEPALAAIAETFGAAVIGADGQLDRRAMRERVFSDASARTRLEAILHPAIRTRMLEQVAAAGVACRTYVVAVVPLLVETGFARHVDRVLLVDCPLEIQRDRLMTRDDISAELAQQMIEAQIAADRRRAAADDIIDNGGPLAWTRAQAWRTHLHYLHATEVCRNTSATAE